MVDLIEIDRYWRNYVTGLNIVVGSMFEKEVDPQNFFDEVTNSVKTITKFIFQNETVNEVSYKHALAIKTWLKICSLAYYILYCVYILLVWMFLLEIRLWM